MCNCIIYEIQYLAPVDPTPSTTSDIAMPSTASNMATISSTSNMTTVSMSDMMTPGSTMMGMYKYLC